jgi:hypothetical protein
VRNTGSAVIPSASLRRDPGFRSVAAVRQS